MVRLAILTTHPIQYHAAWFRALAAQPSVELDVLFCHNATPQEQAQAGFGVEFDWDVSLLDGYSHRFLKNVAHNPTISTFRGLDTPELFSLVNQRKFDVVMVNGWHYKSAWQAMRACWQSGVAVMVRSDSHLHTERPLVKRMSKWPVYRWFISKLDACLPVGKWSHEYFLHYGARPERLHTVQHAIDTDFFSAESERLSPERIDLRRRWGLTADKSVSLFAGKFINKKRPLDFVEAIAKAARTSDAVAGLMVGDGPLRAQCEEIVRHQNLPIQFAGFLNQSEIANAYVASDALVLPSDGGETWGLVVNEAMACGRPCIVSDHVGAGPDMIIPNQTGSIFRLGDTSDLADKILSFISQPDSLMGMKQHSKSMADNYSVRSATVALLQAADFARAANSKIERAA
jgi:glycosyltransferase involved in cell wall biosynthesis